MPHLRVEYAASGRSKCALGTCKKPIAKHELRIGTEVVFGAESDDPSFSWRHLCCFTERQLANSRGSGDINNIDGEEDLAPADKALVERLRSGTLVGDTSVMGRIGDVEHSPLAATLLKKGAAKPKPKKAAAKGGEGGSAKEEGASPAPGEKRPRKPRGKAAAASPAAKAADDGVDSEATDEYEVAVETVADKPRCPYGADCFRTNPEHFQQYAHDNADKEDAPSSGAATTKRKPVIKRKK